MCFFPDFCKSCSFISYLKASETQTSGSFLLDFFEHIKFPNNKLTNFRLILIDQSINIKCLFKSKVKVRANHCEKKDVKEKEEEHKKCICTTKLNLTLKNVSECKLNADQGQSWAMSTQHTHTHALLL